MNTHDVLVLLRKLEPAIEKYYDNLSTAAGNGTLRLNLDRLKLYEDASSAIKEVCGIVSRDGPLAKHLQWREHEISVRAVMSFVGGYLQGKGYDHDEIEHILNLLRDGKKS